MNSLKKTCLFMMATLLAFACQFISTTSEPEMKPLTATPTMVISPLTATPYVTPTQTPFKTECFSIETLTYLDAYTVLNKKYSEILGETINDLDNKDVSVLVKDKVAFTSLIEEASKFKATPIVAEFQRYLLAELTAYRNGLDLLIKGNKDEALRQLNAGNGLAKRRTEIGKSLDRLCYPDLQTPNSLNI